MADYIDREELLEQYGLKEATKYGNKTAEQQANSYDTMMMYEIADMIENMPSVDAVEVVRCKDCKYNGKPYCDLLTTGSRDWYINDNDFCKWGEKE